MPLMTRSCFEKHAEIGFSTQPSPPLPLHLPSRTDQTVCKVLLLHVRMTPFQYVPTAALNTGSKSDQL